MTPPNIHPDEIPFLLQLLDDASPLVQETLRYTLGQAWMDARAQQHLTSMVVFSPREYQQLARLGQQYKQRWLVKQWAQWLGRPYAPRFLEAGLELLSRFQSNDLTDVAVPSYIDELTEEFRRWDLQEQRTSYYAEPLRLSQFIFDHLAFRVVPPNECSPQHYNVVQVLQQRAGSAVLVGCLFMMLGTRLWIRFHACNWPGNFMLQTNIDGDRYFIDCHRKGQWVDKTSFLRMQGPSKYAAKQVLARKASPQRIIARLLHGLEQAYLKHCHFENAGCIRLLQQQLRHPFDPTAALSDHFGFPGRP